MNSLIATLAALALRQAALADKVWNAHPNPQQNNWISGMYAKVSGPLASRLQDCQSKPAANCSVIVQANGGVHVSGSDSKQHFTVRFAGSNAPYQACHIYPQNPGSADNKQLAGANCFDASHTPTYYKLN